MKYFMIDCETMGTDFESDDIIEIALLECDYAGGVWHPGRSYERVLHTSQKPKNDWIATNHKELLEVSRKTPMADAESVRRDITGFFKYCGVEGPAMLMGLNLGGFDVPFMVQKKFLRKPTQDANNKLVGDYHYRLYELKGAVNLTRDLYGGIDEKNLYKLAEGATTDFKMPEGKPHRALYDCYTQLRTLNGLIRLLRR